MRVTLNSTANKLVALTPTFVSVREKLDIDGFIKSSKLLPVSGMLFASVGPITAS